MDDSEVCHPFSNSISSICFSPKHDYLAAGSWDRTVAIYTAHSLSDSKLETMYRHQGPDGSKVLSSGTNNIALVLDTESGCVSLFAWHEKPVKAVRSFENSHQNIFVMGSWDKTVKVWDACTEGPVATISIPERCYALDVRYPFMALGMASPQLQTFDLRCPASQGTVYTVNDIVHHPVHETLATCSLSRLPGPIPCVSFNRNGTLLAYTISYDWS
ncbi:Poly(A)+ RNA export protein [Armillaria luteobubalina]|uniref:Poly(A)+ RNA export protein n=1 Tax=Armillaria luteobubalina TaxID=153913 RepID=A0AA39Q0I9_9AGAR|nr:Poly(A)+ RNA export protein [Armillaria luteobubalina]